MSCDHCLPVTTPHGLYFLDCVLDDDGHSEHETLDGTRFAIITADGTPFSE